jgi:hypothetical protein
LITGNIGNGNIITLATLKNETTPQAQYKKVRSGVLLRTFCSFPAQGLGEWCVGAMGNVANISYQCQCG